MNQTGSGLLYSTYFGGSAADGGNAIVIDAAGNVFVGGFTLSTNFAATPGAVDTSYNSGNSDGFVLRIQF